MDVLELKLGLLNDILAWMEAKNYPYNTRRQYGYTLKWLWDQVGVLDKESLKKVLKKFKHQNQRAVLVLINNYCYEHNIDFRITLPRGVRYKKRNTIKVLPRSDIDLMIKASPYPYDLALKCVFRIGAGLRISEVIKLSWYHFNWPTWVNNREDEGKVDIKGSKGHDRVITVPRSLMEEIYSYAKEKNILNEFGVPIGGLVFMFGNDYKPKLRMLDLEQWKNEYIRYAYDWFRYNIIKQKCNKALGYNVTVHQLRHSRATHLLEDGVPVEIIQKLLGHQDIRTTMIYLEVSDKQMFEAMKGRD